MAEHDPATSVLDLSPACLAQVLGNLSIQELGQAACVQPFWRSVTDREELWKHQLQQTYGLEQCEGPDGTPASTYKAAAAAWQCQFGDVQGPALQRMLHGWRCIRAWAAKHLPEMLPTFCPGLTPQQLEEVQQQWGVTLPQGLQILYRMVNGQHVRTFLGRLLETPFPVFPSPGQQQHHQAAAAAAAAAAGGQGGGAPHHHAQQQHQQQHQEEESEEQQAALQHTLFLGMFGGYMFYHYLVNMRLLPLTKALALTQQLRRQHFLTPNLLVVGCSLDPKNKLLLVDSNTEEVFLSGDQHNPFPAAPAADPEQPGAATLTPFVRWFGEYGRRLEVGWYEACDLLEDPPPDIPTRGINLFPLKGPHMQVAVTRGVQVRVSNLFVPERSRAGQYMFTYCVRMSLLTPEQAAAFKASAAAAAAAAAAGNHQPQQPQQQAVAAAAPTPAVKTGVSNPPPAAVGRGSGRGAAAAAAPGGAPAAGTSDASGTSGTISDDCPGAEDGPCTFSSCQLVSRRWVQRDVTGFKVGDPVVGDGVIGKYPILVPGAPEFAYCSCTHAETNGQTMGGGFTFVEGSIMQPSGPRFEVRCPRMVLRVLDYVY